MISLLTVIFTSALQYSIRFVALQLCTGGSLRALSFFFFFGRTFQPDDVHGDMSILGTSRKPWLRQQQNSPNGEVQQDLVPTRHGTAARPQARISKPRPEGSHNSSSTFLAGSCGFLAHGDLPDCAAIQHSILLRFSCAQEAATKLCFFAVACVKCGDMCGQVAFLLVRRISVV